MSGAGDQLVRWCVQTEDRIGMVRDVVGIIATASANVEAMEVVAGVLYIRFRVARHALRQLRSEVMRIPGVKRIEDIEKLPFEEDEARLVRRVMNHPDAASDLSFGDLVCVSDEMRRVVEMAKTVAQADMPVLICGESGTGKELLARALHNASLRRERRFVPVNCAAVPDALMESEMFGYVEGAFTGAVKGGRPGLFEVAEGGTLFLDEVGELNPVLQAKLLRALADGEVRRVGAASPVHVDVRVIAATNRDLRDMVNTGRFRKDLFYRLNVMPLYIPPLRERTADILPLAEHFLRKTERKLGRACRLAPTAQKRLLSYHFPGNVRELQNIVERACYLAEGGTIDEQHLWLEASESPSYRAELNGGTLKEHVRRFERRLIEQAIREFGSLRAAARRLGVTHTTLSNKLRSHGIDPEQPDG
jgi:transcriptional regulator of aroF, aroG, tyrA and aromatic amino acid transport